MYVTSKVNRVYCIQLETTTFNVGYQMRNGFVLDRVSEYFQSSDSKSCLVLRRIRCTVHSTGDQWDTAVLILYVLCACYSVGWGMEQGMAEIQLMKDRLSASRRFSGSASEWLLPLHSSVASSDQRRVFQRPPSGNRKVGVTLNSWTDRFKQIFSKQIETKVL